MATRSKPKPKVDRQAVYILGGLAVALLVFLWWQHRANASSFDTSGTPGPDRSGSAAQTPTGGAASIPGQAPYPIVTQPDTLQKQVQGSDTSSLDAPSMLQTSAPTASDLAPVGGANTSLQVLPLSTNSDSSPYSLMVQGDVAHVVYTPTVTAGNPSAALAGASVGPQSTTAYVTPQGVSTGFSAPTDQGTVRVNVDPSGHVVSPKGTRVGGPAGDF